MSDSNIKTGFWQVPENQSVKKNLDRIQTFGEYRRQSGIEKTNEVEDALQDESRVSNELGQARSKFDGWNLGNVQNQRPLLNSGIADIVSPRYPFFKRTYINIDSRMRDKSINLRPNNYQMYLNNSFENVQYIRLIDVQTLSPTPVIHEGVKQISWIFLPELTDDNLGFTSSVFPIMVTNPFGLYYNVSIPDGNYTTDELAMMLETAMNSVIRKPQTLPPALFFSKDTLKFQERFNLQQPTIWTRDWNACNHAYSTSPTTIKYYNGNDPEAKFNCYHPIFNVSIYPQTGNVNILCRMEELSISRIRTEAGRPWIEITLDLQYVQYISGIQVICRGSGFNPNTPPQLSIVGGSPIVAAEATAVVSFGEVITINLTEPGSKYIEPPIITLIGGGFATIATAVALINPLKTIGKKTSCEGLGYLSVPEPFLTSNLGYVDGTGERFKVSLNTVHGCINDIQFENTGHNFSQNTYTLVFAPTSPDNYHARARTTINNSGNVDGIIVDFSTLYIPGEIFIIGKCTTPARAHTEYIKNSVDGDAWKIILTDSGSGYLSAPKILFGGHEDSIYTILPDTSGKIKEILVTSGGRMYSSIPTITITPAPIGGIDASALANIITYGEIKSILMTNYGHGYTDTPSVHCLDTMGTGVVFQATVSKYLLNNGDIDLLYNQPNGTIKQINVLDHGEGYPPNKQLNIITFPGNMTIITVNTNSNGQIDPSTVNIISGGNGFFYPPILYIDENSKVPAVIIPILNGMLSGPPIIISGVRESKLDVGGLSFNWWDQNEFYPFDVLRTKEQTAELDEYSNVVDIPSYVGTKLNNIIVPTFAPVYLNNETGNFVTLHDAFDAHYPIVDYDPNDDYPFSYKLMTRVPGVYRLHPVLFNNLKNIYNFGVAQTSCVYNSAEYPEIKKIRIGRGIPFKWVFSRSDLNVSACNAEHLQELNINLNIDGSINSILPTLGFATPSPTENISMFSYINGYRCIHKNYDYMNSNYVQTLLQIFKNVNSNGGIKGDDTFTPLINYISNVPIAPLQFPIYNWPNFVQVSDNSYIIAGESYYYLQFRLFNNTAQNIGSQLIPATNNNGIQTNSNGNLHVDPISLNPIAYIKTTKTELGTPEIPVFVPINNNIIQKSFDAIFAKVLVPYGRVLMQPRTIIFEGVYLDEIIRNLDSIIVQFVDYQGKNVDWRTEHSLTLEIVERKETLKETYVSSRIGDVLIAGGGTRTFPSVPASIII